MSLLLDCAQGTKLVGFDASGLELRMLAHYMDDEEFNNVPEKTFIPEINTLRDWKQDLKQRLSFMLSCTEQETLKLELSSEERQETQSS